MKLRLSPTAIRDLKDLRAYIAADSSVAANKVAKRLVGATKLIAHQPGIGRPTPNRPTREWSVPGLPYLIPYHVVGDTVEILRIWHTSRERPSEW